MPWKSEIHEKMTGRLTFPSLSENLGRDMVGPLFVQVPKMFTWFSYCTHTHTHTHTHTYIYIYTSICTNNLVPTLNTATHTHTHIHTYIHIYISIYTNDLVPTLNTATHTHTHT